MIILKKNDLKDVVDKAVKEVKVTDVHTHLFAPEFGDLSLWGVDELLTYHYLIAETFRFTDLDYDKFWSMSKREQADFIWQTLFVENTPYSEACRGVLTTFNRLGLDVSKHDLSDVREYFNDITLDEYVDKVFDVAGVKDVVMTNDPFDDQERAVWDKGLKRDKRFHAALRIDPLLNSWEDVYAKLQAWGYNVEKDLSGSTYIEVRRFLSDYATKMNALYMAVSLPPNFHFLESSLMNKLIENCVLPICRELNIPFALMVGVKRQVNPRLRLAGESVGKSDIETIEYLCANYPDNKFMVTLLSRENQHELAVVARKFRNLMIFGCWWFLNNPSLIEEITRMRLELLGSSFIPQHSDARVLDQLVYKWSHSRKVIAKVLFDKYSDLLDTGWRLTDNDIYRDVDKLFSKNFWDFVGKR